jgi:hypothetical protein
VPQGQNLSAIELSAKPSTAAMVCSRPFLSFAPHNSNVAGSSLCALPKWSSSDRVRLLSSVCMFQMCPNCPAFGRQPLFWSVLPCIPFERRTEEFRAIPCKFSFLHFVALLISAWQDDAGAPLTVTGMLSQREFMPVCSSEPLLIITIKLVSIPCDGLPPIIVYQNLYPYLRQNVQHIIISFDLSTPNSINDYAREASTLAQRIQSGDLVR